MYLNIRRGAVLVGMVCVLAVSQASCGSYDITQYGPAIVPVFAVKITPQTLHLSAIGETRQLSATIEPANASDRTIIWETTDSLVASVDSFGKVTAKGAGFGVFVTAFSHDRQHQASANVSVEIAPLP